MRLLPRTAGILFVCMLLAGSIFLPAEAGHAGGWAPDARVPGYLDDTYPPVLVADRDRTVHAFASQWVESGIRSRAIVYRQWTSKGGWTRPVDIILAPKGDAVVLGVFLDTADRFHLILKFGDSSFSAVYYSSASAEDAGSAGAWLEPVMVGAPLALESAAITGDGDGNLLIAYSGTSDGNGIYFTESSDSGENWSQSAPLYLTYDSELTPYSLRLAPGSDHQVRAAWNVVTNLGVDKLLYFANFDLRQKTWSIPAQLDEQHTEVQDAFGPSFPVVADTGRQIVLMYNTGNPFPDRPVKPGRPVQAVLVSNDNGETWNGPSVPFPFHVGRSGEHAMVLDGEGIPHAIFVQRIELDESGGEYEAVGGVWHSAFRNGTWTNPERFATTYAPHDLHAVVSQGNVMLVTWREDPGSGRHGIWFSFITLDAAELPVVPLATAAVGTPVQATPTPAFTRETATPLPPEILEGSQPSVWQSNPAFPLIVAAIPVALVVLGAVVAFRVLSDRKM